MRVILSVAALIIGLSAVTLEAKAGLEGQFQACLEEYGGKEQPCLDRLGPAAWMPRDDATCMAVAERIEGIVEAGGLERFPDLFRNERCARLNRPHNEEAAAAGSPATPDRSYAECHLPDRMIAFYACDDIVGIRKWRPNSEAECRALSELTAGNYKTPRNRSWGFLFQNERCRRFGWEYFMPDGEAGGGFNLVPD